MACIGLIIAGGRTLLRPIYRRMADMGNTDVFAATTLLVVLGTSVLTQIAGLSLALGAFLVSSVQVLVLIPVVRSLSEIHSTCRERLCLALICKLRCSALWQPV